MKKRRRLSKLEMMKIFEALFLWQEPTGISIELALSHRQQRIAVVMTALGRGVEEFFLDLVQLHECAIDGAVILDTVARDLLSAPPAKAKGPGGIYSIVPGAGGFGHG